MRINVQYFSQLDLYIPLEKVWIYKLLNSVAAAHYHSLIPGNVAMEMALMNRRDSYYIQEDRTFSNQTYSMPNSWVCIIFK